jgi:hypothetical protein
MIKGRVLLDRKMRDSCVLLWLLLLHSCVDVAAVVVLFSVLVCCMLPSFLFLC